MNAAGAMVPKQKEIEFLKQSYVAVVMRRLVFDDDVRSCLCTEYGSQLSVASIVWVLPGSSGTIVDLVSV